MRVAALYDIHGNLPALEAVLEEIRKADVDEVVVGGDVVPGPMPEESLRRLLELDRPAHFIHGNGELAVLTHMTAPTEDAVTCWGTTSGARPPEPVREIYSWTAQQLRPDDERGSCSECGYCGNALRNDRRLLGNVGSPGPAAADVLRPRASGGAHLGHVVSPGTGVRGPARTEHSIRDGDAGGVQAGRIVDWDAASTARNPALHQASDLQLDEQGNNHGQTAEVVRGCRSSCTPLEPARLLRLCR